MLGKVKWFNIEKGYGFVAGEDGNDAFIHVTDISDTADTLILLPEMVVEYQPVEGRNGKPKATNLTILSK